MRKRSRTRFARTGIRRKAKTYWVSDMFGDAPDISATSAPSFFGVLEYNDIEGSTTTLRHEYTCKRIVLDFSLFMRPLVNGTGISLSQSNTFLWMLVKLDVEDTDTSLVTAAQGSILQSSRVLRYGQVSTCWFSPSQTAASNAHTYTENPPRILVDWQGGVKMSPDDVIWFAYQRFAPTGDQSSYAEPIMMGTSRALISL